MSTFALGMDDAELFLGLLENETREDDHAFLKRALREFILSKRMSENDLKLSGVLEHITKARKAYKSLGDEYEAVWKDRGAALKLPTTQRETHDLVQAPYNKKLNAIHDEASSLSARLFGKSAENVVVLNADEYSGQVNPADLLDWIENFVQSLSSCL